jgi:hypothetical protein
LDTTSRYVNSICKWGSLNCPVSGPEWEFFFHGMGMKEEVLPSEVWRWGWGRNFISYLAETLSDLDPLLQPLLSHSLLHQYVSISLLYLLFLHFFIIFYWLSLSSYTCIHRRREKDGRRGFKHDSVLEHFIKITWPFHIICV